MEDLFIAQYDASELKIAAEFLTNWLPFLTKDLCQKCADSMRDRIRSLDPEGNEEHSDIAEVSAEHDENGEISGPADHVRMSWADMAQEDELATESATEDFAAPAEDDAKEVIKEKKSVCKDNNEKKTELSREQREHIRFNSVTRKNDFICLERVGKKITNILQGLELHTGVFSAAEQRRVVDFVHELQRNCRSGELPEKKTRDKEPVTIQFGCCTISTMDKDGTSHIGIMRNRETESIPSLLKVIIRRLIRWHVLPPSCIPDSCVVHVLEPGDSIPPRIDGPDFLRPFCAVSLVNECNIVFGSATITLPVGSAFVFNGNGANIAKHCISGVPRKRIFITFRRMDEAKRPSNFQPEPDLQDIQPLAYECHVAKKKPPRRRSSRVVIDGRSTGDSPPPSESPGILPLPAGRTVVVDQQRIIVRRNLEETSTESPVYSRSGSSVNRLPREGRPRHLRRDYL